MVSRRSRFLQSLQMPKLNLAISQQEQRQRLDGWEAAWLKAVYQPTKLHAWPDEAFGRLTPIEADLGIWLEHKPPPRGSGLEVLTVTYSGDQREDGYLRVHAPNWMVDYLTYLGIKVNASGLVYVHRLVASQVVEWRSMLRTAGFEVHHTKDRLINTYTDLHVLHSAEHKEHHKHHPRPRVEGEVFLEDVVLWVERPHPELKLDQAPPSRPSPPTLELKLDASHQANDTSVSGNESIPIPTALPKTQARPKNQAWRHLDGNREKAKRKAQVLRFIEEQGGPTRTRAIHAHFSAIGWPRRTLERELAELVSGGNLSRSSQGRYLFAVERCEPKFND